MFRFVGRAEEGRCAGKGVREACRDGHPNNICAVQGTMTPDLDGFFE